ncbi:MAG TPA: AAA family ATPase [Candidatus Paceibacterota bacterium]|nr:AAA family ATPase [Candidatus Paceibacterota bacterium]
MRLQHIEIAGFKSFAKKTTLTFDTSVTAIVGPNGSGKSNVVEAFRFVLGEQSVKSMRGKSGGDLIFRGSAHHASLSRASVSITFDNKDGIFAFQGGSQEARTPVLFDIVTFTRELFADGTSTYLLNGTEIRLKQMVELLASVNIGASSHHIISQGEADSMLRASPRDRREMLEEALGLKIYHYRIKESESKLAKATETLKEVQSLRRELAPHLSFLKKQVEKIEKGRSLREELKGLLTNYLATEKALLEEEVGRIDRSIATIEDKKATVTRTLATLAANKTPNDTVGLALTEAYAKLEHQREARRTIEHRIGRLEGMIEAERRIVLQQRTTQPASAAISFAPSEYERMLADLDFFVAALKKAATLQEVSEILVRMESVIQTLRARGPEVVTAAPSAPSTQIDDIAHELEALQGQLQKIIAEEAAAQLTIRTLEQTREKEQTHYTQAIASRYELQGTLAECNAELHVLSTSKEAYRERKERFDTDIKEAAFLFGPQFLHTLHDTAPTPEIDLRDIRHAIDRLKIRLEEHSGIGNDVVTEYEATLERDTFLTREVSDTEASMRNLEVLIADLKGVLDEKFTHGITTVNERFGEFFKTMFGGGGASLSITIEKKRKRRSDEDLLEEETAEEEEGERGIDVHVNLPEKKVKELTMLSGGERSLVSIALLFAISQVNPPPFLVLDETDAALDEANSRKYGDMIERLAEYSQLIVVTHNRETMSRASVLYGVTLGADGGSKLLSIKFDEAVKVAK